MEMKATILTIAFCSAIFLVFGQKFFKTKSLTEEALEIAYLSNCLKEHKKVDSLLEWELYNKSAYAISYKYSRDRSVFFQFEENSKGVFLKEVVYYHRSFQKVILRNEKSTDYQISSPNQFKVWMSRDKLSIYFCMVSPDSLIISVLSNGNNVYSRQKDLIGH